MEEYLKKNPSKINKTKANNETKKESCNQTTNGTTSKGVSKDEMKKEMENKIKEHIDKKHTTEDHHNITQEKEVKHYKEYTHQPEKADTQS
jgi:hypothetical protein